MVTFLPTFAPRLGPMIKLLLLAALGYIVYRLFFSGRPPLPPKNNTSTGKKGGDEYTDYEEIER
jgi:hypothetical protein